MTEQTENEERSNELSVESELQAMQNCIEALNRFDDPTQLARVMRYLNDRFAPEESPDAG